MTPSFFSRSSKRCPQIRLTAQDAFREHTVTQLKAELECLCQQVEQMLIRLPVKEAAKDTPKKKWYDLSAEGLIEAAKIVIATVAKILSFLL